MVIEKHTLKVTTTGSAGSASGSAQLALAISRLVAIHLNYDASAPGATTDVTVKTPGNPATKTLLTVSNNATDGWYFPKEQDMGNTGSLITGSYSDPLIHNNLLIEVAQGDALTDILTATVYVDVG